MTDNKPLEKNESSYFSFFYKYFEKDENEGNQPWETEEFKELFNGYYDIGGESEPYSKALSFLNKKDGTLVHKIIEVCIVVLEKPTSYLFAGISGEQKRNNNKGKKETIINHDKTLKDDIIEYMPKLTKQEINSMDEDTLDKMMEARQQWKDSAILVNVTKCKRIALVGLQLREKISKPQKLWIKKYNGKPSSAKYRGKGGSSTEKIFNDMIKEFNDSKKDWNQKKWVELVNIEPTGDGKSIEQTDAAEISDFKKKAEVISKEKDESKETKREELRTKFKKKLELKEGKPKDDKDTTYEGTEIIDKMIE